MVKKGTLVVVDGEANQVFCVDKDLGTVIELTTGFCEPRDKCYRVPARLKNKVVWRTAGKRRLRYLDVDMTKFNYELNKLSPSSSG